MPTKFLFNLLILISILFFAVFFYDVRPASASSTQAARAWEAGNDCSYAWYASAWASLGGSSQFTSSDNCGQYPGVQSIGMEFNDDNITKICYSIRVQNGTATVCVGEGVTTQTAGINPAGNVGDGKDTSYISTGIGVSSNQAWTPIKKVQLDFIASGQTTSATVEVKTGGSMTVTASNTQDGLHGFNNVYIRLSVLDGGGPAKINSLEVIPANQTVNSGAAQQYHAWANWSTGYRSEVTTNPYLTWSVRPIDSPDSIGSISNLSGTKGRFTATNVTTNRRGEIRAVYSYGAGPTYIHAEGWTVVYVNPLIGDFSLTGSSECSSNQPFNTLSWTKPAIGTVDGYRIYRSGTLIKTVNNSTFSYTDSTGISSNVTYTYKVEAFTASGASNSKTVDVLTKICTQPQVTLSASPTSVAMGSTTRLTWDSTNATKVVSSNFGATVLSGNKISDPINNLTTFTITVGDDYGQTAVASVTVKIIIPSFNAIFVANTILISRASSLDINYDTNAVNNPPPGFVDLIMPSWKEIVP